MKIPFIGLIGGFLSRVFRIAKPLAEISVKAVNILKDAVESGYVKRLTDLTSTTKDDKILEALRVWLPKAAVQLGLVNDVLSGLDPNQVILELIRKLQAKDKSHRSFDWANIAAMIYMAMEDNEITLSEAIEITQKIYRELK